MFFRTAHLRRAVRGQGAGSATYDPPPSDLLRPPICCTPICCTEVWHRYTKAGDGRDGASLHLPGMQPLKVPAMPADLAEVTPRDAADRQALAGSGMAMEIVRARGRRALEIAFNGPLHLLVLRGHGFTFLPAGRTFRMAPQRPEPLHLTLFYLDPAVLPPCVEPVSWPSGSFEDAGLLATAHKLEALAEAGLPVDERYLDALRQVLWLELLGLASSAPRHGGLAGWQRRAVVAHIEAHLAEPIPLDALAALARLSRHHFCRAFRQSFGAPPHRYHNERRIERAKALLAAGTASITEIGLALGFHETSAFTATFHRLVGTTPSAWRRTRPWEPGDGPSVQLAVMPPSITSLLPVTHADSSDAR